MSNPRRIPDLAADRDGIRSRSGVVVGAGTAPTGEARVDKTRRASFSDGVIAILPFGTSWVGQTSFAALPVALYGADLLMGRRRLLSPGPRADRFRRPRIDAGDGDMGCLTGAPNPRCTQRSTTLDSWGRGRPGCLTWAVRGA